MSEESTAPLSEYVVRSVDEIEAKVERDYDVTEVRLETRDAYIEAELRFYGFPDFDSVFQKLGEVAADLDSQPAVMNVESDINGSAPTPDSNDSGRSPGGTVTAIINR
jgi:hypothetical protein